MPFAACLKKCFIQGRCKRHASSKAALCSIFGRFSEIYVRRATNDMRESVKFTSKTTLRLSGVVKRRHCLSNPAIKRALAFAAAAMVHDEEVSGSGDTEGDPFVPMHAFLERKRAALLGYRAVA